MSATSNSTERMLSIPVKPSEDGAVDRAARRTHRSKASFVRYCVFQELQRMGFMDDDFRVIDESDETSDVTPEIPHG
jgi:hypothetical protein